MQLYSDLVEHPVPFTNATQGSKQHVDYVDPMVRLQTIPFVRHGRVVLFRLGDVHRDAERMP